MAGQDLRLRLRLLTGRNDRRNSHERAAAAIARTRLMMQPSITMSAKP
jgi:hypothetical protein